MINNKKILVIKLVIIMLMIIEFIVVCVGVFFFTVPSAKIIRGFRSTKNGFDTIDHTGYYAIQNASNHNDMALNYDKTIVNRFCHTFVNNLEPFIMFGYMPREIDGTRIQCRIANENFFNLYSFSNYDGRLFETDDFVGSNGDAVPIIVGYNLKDVYSLGEQYTFYHGDDGKSFEGRVIGILQKNADYSSLQEIRETLDNSYIIPLSDYFIDNFFGLSDYDLIVSSAIVNTGVEKLDSIIQKCNEIRFWSMSAVPIITALDDYEKDYLTPLLQKNFLSIVVEFFIVALIIAEIVVLHKLRKNNRAQINQG